MLGRPTAYEIISLRLLSAHRRRIHVPPRLDFIDQRKLLPPGPLGKTVLEMRAMTIGNSEAERSGPSFLRSLTRSGHLDLRLLSLMPMRGAQNSEGTMDKQGRVLIGCCIMRDRLPF